MSSERLLPGIIEAVKRHPKAVIASVGLHVVLLVLLSLSLSSSEIPEQPKPQASTIKAEVVDARKVDEELQRRKQAEQRKVQQALDKQRKIEEEKKRQAALKKQEAERKRIEAQGIADFQTIVAKGISAALLRWKGIEATEKLAESENAKVVVIGSGADGLPLILGGANP